MDQLGVGWGPGVERHHSASVNTYGWCGGVGWGGGGGVVKQQNHQVQHVQMQKKGKLPSTAFLSFHSNTRKLPKAAFHA